MSDGSGQWPVTLVFHKLTDLFTYSITNYPPTRFDRLVEALRSSGWQFSGIDPKAPTSKQGRGELLISFDDGYEHLDDMLPPLIKNHSFQPIVFVPTALVGKPNRWDYSHGLRSFDHLSRESIIRLGACGVVFGSHSATHRDLTGCRGSELQRELGDSRKYLQDVTGQPIGSISYPFGRYNQRVVEAAANAGYEQGFTMEFPKSSDHPLCRGRISVYSFDTLLSVQAKLGEGVLNRVEQWKAKVVNRLSGGTVWLNRLRG